MSWKTKKTNKTKVALLGIAAIAGAVATNSVISELSGSTPHPKLIAEAERLNADLPTMLDDHTRLEFTEALPKKKFAYHYTILGMDRLPRRDDIIIKTRPKVARSYRTEESLKDMRDLGITVVYSYADKSGNEVASFEVGPEDL